MNKTKLFERYEAMTTFIGQNLEDVIDLSYDDKTVTIRSFEA